MNVHRAAKPFAPSYDPKGYSGLGVQSAKDREKKAANHADAVKRAKSDAAKKRAEK